MTMKFKVVALEDLSNGKTKAHIIFDKLENKTVWEYFIDAYSDDKIIEAKVIL